MRNQQGLRGAYRLFGGQMLLTFLAMRLLSITMGPTGILSALMGGITAAVPTFCFARILFHNARASAAKQIMRRVYRGEAFKIVLSILLFALSFGCLNITPVVFFVVYFVVQLTYWVTPWVFVGK